MVLTHRTFVLLTLLGYAIITAAVTLHHEPWRDEADTWLVLRDGGLHTAAANAGNKGEPILFYVPVAPLAEMGLPIGAQNAVNLLFAWGMVAVFLACAPFSRLFKVLFVFSYQPLYELAVIGRPYALGVLLLFTAAALWKRRRERPLHVAITLALLAFATTHMLFVASIAGTLLFAEAVVEKRWRETRVALATGVIVAACALSALMLKPPAGTHGGPHTIAPHPYLIFAAFADAVFPYERSLPVAAAGIACAAAVALAIGRRWISQAFLVASLAALSFIYLFVWYGGPRHGGLLLIVMIAALWMANESGPSRGVAMRVASVALMLTFAVSIVAAARYSARELREPFSTAKQMAELIRRNGLDRYEIAAERSVQGEAVLPYLPGVKFYYPDENRFGTYMLWDTRQWIVTRRQKDDAVARTIATHRARRWLLLRSRPAEARFIPSLRLIAQTGGTIDSRGERFWLYAPTDWPGALPAVR